MKAIAVTPAQNLKASLQFYKNLEYQYLEHEGNHYVSDGKLIIQLDHRPQARAGIIFFTSSNLDEWSTIEVNGLTTGIDPNGVFTYFKAEDEYPTLNFIDSQALTGNFAGISIESFEMTKTQTFWAKLGYKVTAGKAEHGWIQLENDSNIGISIMKYGACPHSFRNPSFTYFNGKKNLDIINNIKNSGVFIAEEITHFNPENKVDNIVLVDPGGFGFFIFSD